MLGRFIFHFVRITRRLFALYVLLVTAVIACAAVITAVEEVSFGEAVYFAFITGLTIGYGDIVPDTAAGMITSVLLGFIGIFFTGLYVAVSVQSIRYALEETRDKTKPELKPPVRPSNVR